MVYRTLYCLKGVPPSPLLCSSLLDKIWHISFKSKCIWKGKYFSPSNFENKSKYNTAEGHETLSFAWKKASNTWTACPQKVQINRLYQTSTSQLRIKQTLVIFPFHRGPSTEMPWHRKAITLKHEFIGPYCTLHTIPYQLTAELMFRNPDEQKAL